MTKVTTKAEQVANGVALLDEKVPGWHERINTEKLTIHDNDNCIVGQLSGGQCLSFCENQLGLGCDLSVIANYGFFSYGPNDTELDSLWVSTINQRKTPA